MRISRNSAALGVIALILAGAAIPALSQEAPESILPPGFGEPVTPAPTPTPGQTPRPGTPAATGAGPMVQPLPTPTPSPTPSPTPTGTGTPEEQALARYTLPDYARRSLARVGAAGSSDGGLRADAFGTADGPMLEMLMRRLDTPIASRWLSIALRRALASSVDTPAGLNGADFAAERGWLLLRMGESVVARGVVQNVDTDNYTPKLLQVAMQAALATGDPAALCQLTDTAYRFKADTPGWVLARAMCAGLSGDPATADALLSAARRHGVAGGIDLRLAEKVLGAGSNGRRAVTIEWLGVDRLNAWRYGMAAATGVDIPAELYDTVGPQVRAWRALSPMYDISTRAAFAESAAARGMFSNAALVDLYGAIDAGDDQGSAEMATARDLRSAYVEADRDDRLSALRGLWDDAKGEPAHYARLVLTARAAARIAPLDDTKEADRLIAAMLSAGLDRTAERWDGHVARGSDGWAMLALADPEPRAALSYGDIDALHDVDTSAGALKSRMFLAGAAGLGRLSADDASRAARALDLRIGVENSWTRALDRAVKADQPGTVLLLAGIGMQTPDWTRVPPEALYRIVAALRAVGLAGEARMIAAEAIARL